MDHDSPTNDFTGEGWTGVLESPPGAEVVIDGRHYLYFAGTAYLALQGHPAVIDAGCEALRRYGVHPATSRGGFGTSPPLLEVERAAAEFFGAAAAFYYISGYWGVPLILGALELFFDAVFYDEHSHASLLEAIKLSGRPATPFAHRSAENLAAQLRDKLPHGQRPLVLSDGVFAASGRIAPVAEYLNVLREYQEASLVLDDAHAVGVLGDAGRGTLEHAGIPFAGVNLDPDERPQQAGPRLYCCGTLSKALGGSGGIIAGSAAWVARVKSSSRYYNAASVPASPVAGATAAALRLVRGDPGFRIRLSENAAQLRAGLAGMGLQIEDSPVPFLSLVINDAAHMRRIQNTLRQRGIIIAYFPAYSGVGSEGCLRIAVSSAHKEEMIGRLLEEMAKVA